MKSPVNLNKLSQDLLLKVKMQEDSSGLQSQLEKTSFENLIKSLDSDKKKLAFWINSYNAYFQILRKIQQVQKKNIYTKELIPLAGKMFSLDDIEHGILRRYRYKYSLGLFPNIFTASSIKKLAVSQIDYRIHFALNCGAKSCPPIAFYNYENLDVQLDLATQSFLESESKFDDDTKTVYTTALFKWFKFDFGGQQGIRKIFIQQLNKNIDGYTIKYNDYSWEEQLDNYA